MVSGAVKALHYIQLVRNTYYFFNIYFNKEFKTLYVDF